MLNGALVNRGPDEALKGLNPVTPVVEHDLSMALVKALEKARNLRVKLEKSSHLFSMEAEFHVDIITGRKSCHHECVNKTTHHAYHADLMLSANEHAFKQQTLSSHTRCVIENLERHINERKAVLEEQKLTRQLTFIDRQVNYEPLTK